MTKYHSGDPAKKNMIGRACGTYDRCTQILVWKFEVKVSVGRPRRRWKDNINMNLKYDGGVDCIDLAQDSHRWWAYEGMVRTFGFHKIRTIS